MYVQNRSRDKIVARCGILTGVLLPGLLHASVAHKLGSSVERYTGIRESIAVEHRAQSGHRAPTTLVKKLPESYHSFHCGERKQTSGPPARVVIV